MKPIHSVKGETNKVCIKLSDGAKVYKCTNCAVDTYYNEQGSVIPLPDLTGSTNCETSSTECRESQEWTYGIDNTGTHFSWPNAEYSLKLSDGSTINWTQTTASAGGWTAQLTEWSNSLQAAATAAGLDWFVEPRAVNNPNPTDISGNYGNTPTGLPGAPSEPVALALIAGGMVARYVNIQICPGQPVPVSGVVVSHDDSPSLGGIYDNNGRAGMTLTTAGAVLGPINKFKVCVDCGPGVDTWYILDKSTGEYRIANAGEIPNCWEPCGTLALAAAPPDRDCEFFIDLACDDNGNNGDQANYTNQITRRATVCNGEQIALEYFTEDPSDPTALIAYELVGDFVDCTSGEIIELPLVDGILVKCDEPTISESYESDIRIVGAKNPIPVFISENCCVTPADLECIKKRTFDFVYDNGFTPGSSTNNGGERNNFVRFGWTFTSRGWETGAGLKGVGDAIGPYTGWSDQLTGWSTFGNNNDPYNSISAFNFYGSPTWRGWSVTGCNPSAKYGTWAIQRDDGVTFKVYPTLYTEKIERIYRSHELDCDGNINTRYWEINPDGLTYTEVPVPDDIECFVSCDYIFEPVILEGAVSPCETKEYTPCDRVDTLDSSQDVQFVLLVTNCEGVITRERYTFDSYNNATSPDDLVEYTVVGDLVICGTNEVFVEPEPVVVIEECDKYEICINGIKSGWQVKTISTDGVIITHYEDENGIIEEPDSWTIGNCVKSTECIKWRNKYIGIDNTGSTFNVDQTIEIRDVDDNVVGSFVATASGNNTEQLNKWIAGIQPFYPNALIEQRYAPSGGLGLPAPTDGIEFTQMAARYVQFTACDGDDLPQSLYITESNGNPTNILMDTEIIFGEEQRGYICYQCGETPTLYYSNGDLIPEADIPPCYITCSEDFEEEATVQTLSEVEICADGTTAIERTVIKSDGSEIISYRNATGDITTPVNFTYGRCVCEAFDYFSREGITSGLRNREWHDTEPATGVISNEEVSIANGTGFRERHDFSLPPDTDNVSTTLELNDTNNTANRLDIQVKDGYIIATEQVQARYSGASEGYWAIELGKCCGELELINQSGGFSSNPLREMLFTIPKGIHRIRLWNIDNGGSNSSATFSYSLDGGLSYINDNTPPNLIISQTKPSEICLQGYLCEGAHFELDRITPVVFGDLVSLCKLECNNSGGDEESTGGNVTVDNFPDECPEIDLTLTTQTGTGNIPAGFKSVTINNITGITTINGGFQLGTGRRVDSISFGTDRSNCTNELLPAYTVVSTGSHQWIGHR